MFVGSLSAQVNSVVFLSTGATQTFVIPSCASQLSLSVIGGAGANAGWSTASGAMIYATMTPTPGEILYINAGGIGTVPFGGWNGGGNGGTGTTNFGGGGGGATDIRIGGNALSNRVLVMGGGGGSGNSIQISAHGGVGSAAASISCPPLVGYYNGGAGGGGGSVFGGGGACAGGAATAYGTGGAGGGMTSGGGTSGGGFGGFGQAGSIGVGGNGGGNSTTYGGTTGGVYGAGGGGGGYYGGAGGMAGATPSSGFPASGGGGGGSSYINTAFFSNIVPGGVPMSAGNVIIHYSLTGPPISVIGSSALCNAGSVTLTANGVSTYTWLPVNDFSGSNLSSISHTPSVTTTYTVVGTNTSGCVSTKTFAVNIYTTIPTLSISNTSSVTGGVCPSNSVTLSASGAPSHSWTGGVVSGTPFVPSSTNQTYIVTGSNACGTSTASASVSIHPFPTLNPVTSSSTLCSGNGLTLTALGNATNYVWSGGAGTISNGVGFTPTLTATYTVIGTSALSCTASATIPVTVYSTPNTPPTANPTLICAGASSTLSASGATSYTWASSTQTVNSAGYTVTFNTGTTTYTITRSNSSCFTTQTISVITNSLPSIVAFVNPTVVCVLNSATLTAGGAINYTWAAPGPPSFTSTVASLIVYPQAPSVYSLAASDGTCINTSTVFLNANPNPTISITVSSHTLCSQETVAVTGTGASSANSYSWVSSGGATFTGQNITHSPSLTTSYSVVASNSLGCTSSANLTVLVHPKPTIIAATNKILVCNGGSATLTPSGANSYTWNSNVTSQTGGYAVVNPTATTSGAVIYTVQGSNTVTGCSNTKTVMVNVFIPTLTVSGNTITCSGNSISLNASGGILATYNWDNGNGVLYPPFSSISPTITSPSVFTVTANSLTTQPISLTCPASQTIAVAIYSNPTITAATEKTIVCLNESTKITASGGNTYNWSTNTSGSTITVTPQIGTSNYTVTGTNTNGCKSTATINVEVLECTGISKVIPVTKGVLVYPNPNNGNFIIETTSAITLNLISSLGQLVKIITLTENNNYKQSLVNLAEGVYFISGESESVLVNQKIIVSK